VNKPAEFPVVVFLNNRCIRRDTTVNGDLYHASITFQVIAMPDRYKSQSSKAIRDITPQFVGFRHESMECLLIAEQ